MTEQEFLEHYDACHKRLIVYLSRRFGHDISQDIAQQAWMLAWAKRDTFRRDAAFYSWVTRIAINAWLDSRRGLSGRAYVAETQMTRDIQRVMRDTHSLERSIIVDDELRAAQARLRRKDIRLFKMSFVYGMTSVEVAEKMKLNVNTVKVNIMRLRDRMAS